MAMEIIDGHAGKPHINGEDLTALNIGTFGEGDYVLSFGDGLEATMTTSNQVTIGTGALVHAGRRSVNLSAQSLIVQSGTQGQKRNDLVVSRYSAVPSGSDTIESEDLVVIKGTPVSYGEAADPEITDNDMPLWRIPIDGITPGTPVQLFEVMKPMSELWDSVSQVAHPIGSLYWSSEPTDPATLFPGTAWERVKDVFVLAAGDSYAAGDTGGEAEHTLSVDEMPRHIHELQAGPRGREAGWNAGSGDRLAYGQYAAGRNIFEFYSRYTTANGSSEPHNNMPPYRAFYCWVRVS